MGGRGGVVSKGRPQIMKSKISAILSASLDRASNDISDNNVEHFRFFDDEGNQITWVDPNTGKTMNEIIGTEGEVHIPPEAAKLLEGKHGVHNHPPHENGEYGGTFSPADISSTVDIGQASETASTDIRDHVLEKIPGPLPAKYQEMGYSPKYFAQDYDDYLNSKPIWGKYKQECDNYDAMYKAGTMNRDQYQAARIQAWDELQAKLRNWLTKNAPYYGYIYREKEKV